LFEIKGVSLGPGAAEAEDTLWLLLQLARESTSRPIDGANWPGAASIDQVMPG